MPRLILYAIFVTFFSLAAVISLATFTSVGRAAIFPDNRYCFHRLYSGLPDEARVLLIGSSRIWLGLDPDQLAEALDLPRNAVINLAHTHRDYDFDRLVIEDLTRNTQIDLVLFDTLPPPEGRNPIGSELVVGKRLFGAYYVNGSSYADLFGELAEAPRGLAVRLHDMLRALQYRHQRMVPLLVGGRVWQTLSMPESDWDRDRQNICWNREWDEKHRVFDPERRVRRSDIPADSASFETEKPDHQRFRAAHEDMIALAERNSFRAAFLFAPAWRSGAPGADFVTEIEAGFGVPYLAPPEEMIAGLKATSYGDSAHLNRDGRTIFTAWLAEAIKDEGLLSK